MVMVNVNIFNESSEMSLSATVRNSRDQPIE